MKKLLIACLYSFIVILLASCDKNDEPLENDEPIENITQKFEFVVNENFLLENERKWVLVYDENNVLLAEGELENNMTIVLEWESEESQSMYTVQIIRAFNDSMDEEYEINTYKQVEPGVWNLNGKKITEQPASIGEIKIDFVDFDISDFDFHHVNNLGGSNSYQYNNSIVITQYYDPDKIWICLYNKNETPYYCLKENVSLNENLTISMSDLAPMENFIEYEFPLAEYSDVHLVSNHIFENDIEAHFFIYNIFQYESSSSIRCYYPTNLFSKTNFSAAFIADNVYENMQSIAETPPSEFVRLNITEEISDTGILNFNSVITGEAQYVVHTWGKYIYDNQNGNKIFSYNVYSPIMSNYSYIAPTLPDFITNLNSEIINLNDLEYQQTSFHQIDNSTDFKEFINRTFLNPEEPYSYNTRLYKRVLNH